MGSFLKLWAWAVMIARAMAAIAVIARATLKEDP